MDGPKSVIATFTMNPVLSVSKSGSGQGSVTSNPVGINCGTDCNEPYDAGTSVTLTAASDANSTFEGWSGACGGTSLTCTVFMNGNKTVTATFTANPVVLDVTVSGDGSVTSDPDHPGITCPTDCSEIYDPDTVVTLTGKPGPTAISVTWSGGGCSGTDVPCTVTMDIDKMVTATFS